MSSSESELASSVLVISTISVSVFLFFTSVFLLSTAFPNKSVCTPTGAVLNTLKSSPKIRLPIDLNSSSANTFFNSSLFQSFNLKSSS